MSLGLHHEQSRFHDDRMVEWVNEKLADIGKPPINGLVWDAFKDGLVSGPVVVAKHYAENDALYQVLADLLSSLTGKTVKAKPQIAITAVITCRTALYQRF